MKALTVATAVLAFTLASGAVQAQKPMRIRGDITAFDGKVLSVKSRDGQMLSIALAPDAGVSVATEIKFEDIKQNDYVGITSRRRDDGKLVALEVHYVPPVVPEGHMDWDSAPNTKMTNARVGGMVAQTGNRELTVNYKDGSQTILIPEGIPLVRPVPGALSDLKVGEHIFTVAQVAVDGKLTAQRVTVSKGSAKVAF